MNSCNQPGLPLINHPGMDAVTTIKGDRYRWDNPFYPLFSWEAEKTWDIHHVFHHFVDGDWDQIVFSTLTDAKFLNLKEVAQETNRLISF